WPSHGRHRRHRGNGAGFRWTQERNFGMAFGEVSACPVVRKENQRIVIGIPSKSAASGKEPFKRTNVLFGNPLDNCPGSHVERGFDTVFRLQPGLQYLELQWADSRQ